MRKFLSLFLCCFIVNHSALAEEIAWITGDIEAGLHFEDVSSFSTKNDYSSDVNEKVSNTFFELFPEFQLNFTENFTLQNSWEVMVLKDAGGDDRFFEDQGVVLNEFYLNYEEDQASFFLGKFNPKFGYAWGRNIKSGIWGGELAEEYRLEGKIGIGFAALFDFLDYGQHHLDVATFYDDTTILDDSMVVRRDRTQNGLGDMSDTESLSSYTINIAGTGVWFYPELFYNISYRNLEGTTASLVGQEEGFAIGVGIDLEAFTTVAIEPYIEYVKINGFNSFNNRFNFDFGDDAFMPGDADYVSFFLPVSYQKWHFNYIYSSRDTDSNIPANDIGKYSTEEQNIGYSVTENVRVILGRKEDILEDSYKRQSSSLLIKYDYSF